MEGRVPTRDVSRLLWAGTAERPLRCSFQQVVTMHKASVLRHHRLIAISLVNKSTTIPCRLRITVKPYKYQYIYFSTRYLDSTAHVKLKCSQSSVHRRVIEIHQNSFLRLRSDFTFQTKKSSVWLLIFYGTKVLFTSLSFIQIKPIFQFPRPSLFYRWL